MPPLPLDHPYTPVRQESAKYERLRLVAPDSDSFLPTERLGVITHGLDDYFGIAGAEPDPEFSRHLPAVYEAEGRDWRSWMEPDFARRFNGLMIRGGGAVQTVFLASFPSDDVLRRFITQADRGDLLFLHHPMDLESGDPRGDWGGFFRPIPAELLRAMRAKRLSVYSCHAPLDDNLTISTSRSIAAALGGTIVREFFPGGPRRAGVIAELRPTSTAELECTLRRVFGVPYLDVAGVRPAKITTVAIVAGAGDRVEQMAIAEAAGAQAYITGEIHPRIDTDDGHTNFADVERFASTSGMALIGVSHAASEFLVMQNEMRAWFSDRFAVSTALIPEAHWWR
jgi:putative NIF3 family GTP cyclohydrolase 1 type 2